jgi:outer membrane protein assembly factor BamA
MASIENPLAAAFRFRSIVRWRALHSTWLLCRERICRAARLALHFAFAAPFLLSASTVFGEEALRIGRIDIHTLDVFSPEEASHGWIYRTANVLHIKTRDDFIRKYLLFQEGDPYDPAVLAESERNLRALHFIKLASVVAGTPHDGVVDVDVTTQDGWTLELGGNLGSSGGQTTYGVSLSENNLLGTGRRVSIDYDKEFERTVRSFSFTDPYLFRPFWTGALTYENNSDGSRRLAQISRPFYSSTAPWATSGLYDDLAQNEKVYASGVVSSEFRQDHRQILAQYGIALTRSEQLAQRISWGYNEMFDDFSNLDSRPDDTLPEDRHFRYLFLQYDTISNAFLKLNYVNRDLRYEDFNLGWTLSTRLGVSPKAFGVDRTTGFVSAAATKGWELGVGRFILAGVSFQTRFGGGIENAILSANAQFVQKFDTHLLQTFVTRMQYDQGWNLDGDVQFFADGANGLRGYHLYAFEGNRRFIWNVEQRIFSGKEILQLVAPGLAVFFDTGAAVPPGQSFGFHDLKSDVGVGLRFGIARAPVNNIIRIDLAYAFNADPLGRRGFLVSFSSAQAF